MTAFASPHPVSTLATCDEAEYLRRKWRDWPVDPATGMGSAEMMEAFPPLVRKWSEEFPWQIVKAKAFVYQCEHAALDVSELDWFPAFADWTFTPHSGVHSRDRSHGHPMWAMIEERRAEVLSKADPRYHELLKRGHYNRWGSYLDFDHSAPDWDAILPLGFPGMAARLEANDKGTDYYRARKLAAQGALRLFQRFVERGEQRLAALPASMPPHRAERLRKVVESLRRLRDGAPATALDALTFIYLFWSMSEQFEAIQVRTLGNLDRLIAPYYFADLAAGRTTEAEFREQMRHFWWQWGSLDNFYGQPVYFGGTKADGTTEYGEVSRIMLEVHDELALPTPKLHLKMGASTPDWVWQKSLEMMRRQRAISFLGEEPHARVIQSMGYTAEQARTFMVWGCYEWAIRDSANDIFGAAVNLVNPVEAMLADAKEGTFDAVDFTAFKAEYLRRLAAALTEARECVLVGEPYRGEINPSLLFSMATAYSVETGRDAIIDGTGHGNNTGMWMVGLGTAVDALLGVDEIVFRRHDMGLAELGALMASNWEGREDLRIRMSRSKRKWGNNDPEANRVGAEIVEKALAPVNGLPNGRRGGRFKASGHVALWFQGMGRRTGATPDGRLSGDELSKNISPSMGADTEGVTALVETVSHLDARNLSGDFPLDVALLPATVAGEKGLALMRTVIELYFANGGLVIQFNIANPETLRDAQKFPEKYRNLQVRVCGWNVRWNDLSKVEQDAYIRRAEAIGE